ncbi:MAG: DNA-binding protein [Candidatus Hydrogenedentes bacterium]|nr:DNA-binding protein [Candidatus Hydrogenedentota bacterium]
MLREGTIQIPFNFAAGKIGSRFLIGLRDEQTIFGSRCTSCSKVACPPRLTCPACLESESTFVEVGPDGTLLSLTETAGQGVYGLVLLDGADTALLHRLLGDFDRYVIGTRVTACFAAERIASILDLEGFELIGDSGA